MSPDRIANFDLSASLRADRELEDKLSWEGTFGQYFEMVTKNPDLAMLSHARVARMIHSAGVVTEGRAVPQYNFFADDVYGIEGPLHQLVEIFNGAAQKLEVRKRILLLMGPVGGGKSTIVTLLKRGMERFSQTDEGALYAIKGCPMNEEPLHLIPERVRPQIEAAYGIKIEGDLCPACQMQLKDEYKGDPEQVKVVRKILSEKGRVGIGTFSPSDPKSQDISELTGSIDMSTIVDVGVESDPRAYRFDGELNVANRGIMEFIEMLKCDEKFLYTLITLSQEQNIKTGRFAMIYADEVVVSHTNETEYHSFAANKKSEALQDRIIVVKVPYNLRVSEEVRIYQKLIGESQIKGVHIAPNALKVAAMFAVLSRLEESKKAGMSLVKKMKVYDGQQVGDVGQNDLKELQEETVREGMDGIGPRYVINRLSNALIKDGTRCVNPIDALRALKEGLDQHSSISHEERDRLIGLLADVRNEFNEEAKLAVQRAFVYSFEESTKTLFNNYLDNIEAFLYEKKIKDPLTEEDVEPDERLMRSIEEQIGISESGKKAFREQIMVRVASLSRRGQKIDFSSHDGLREAIEKKLFADMRDIVKVTTSTKTPDQEQQKRINQVIDRLVAEDGYCTSCANELLRYVGTLLSR